MTQQEKITERVRKLLELSKSANVNEAGNAAGAAQELMSKHAITEAMLDVGPDQDQADEDIAVDSLHTHDSRNLPTWKGHLGVGICDVNQCECFRTGNTLRIIGRPSDAASVRYLFSYVAREIDRLSKEESALRGSPGRTWANNFKLGAVSEVSKRLKHAYTKVRTEMKQEAEQGDTLGNGVALVRVNSALTKLDNRKAEATEYGKTRLKLKKAGRTHSNYDSEARDAGRRAGANINLEGGTSRGALGSGNRKRLGG